MGRGNFEREGHAPTSLMTFCHELYKTAELIEMTFGLWAQVDPRKHVLDGGPDPPYEEAILEKSMSVHAQRHSVMSCAKRLNRLRCHLGYGLGCAKGTMY